MNWFKYILLLKKQSKGRPILRAALVFVLITVLASVVSGAKRHDIKKVLVLNSYHPTYAWTRLVVEGIEETFKDYDGIAELDIEYLDARVFVDENYFDNLFRLQKYKADRRRYDVIITVDNNAFEFLMKHRNELYPQVPVVFCGLEDFDDIDFEIGELVTGITEEDIFEPTVEIALKLHPEAKEVLLVIDKDSLRFTSGQVDEIVSLFGKRYGGRIGLRKYFLTEFNTGGLLKLLDGLDRDTVVIFTDSFKDEAGTFYSYEDAKAAINSVCTCPIYILTQRWFGYCPAVGGKLNSGFHQGKGAAEMAVRILNGECVKNIPIIRGELDTYMFDYVQLRRFGISTSQLPAGSVIINIPKSFYYMYKKQVWATIFVFSTLSMAVVLLSMNVLRRKRAERALRESEQKFKAIFDNAKDGILLAEAEGGRLLIGNQMLFSMLGYDINETAPLVISDIIPQNSKDGLWNELKDKPGKSSGFLKSVLIEKKGGGGFYADVNYSSVMLADKKYYLCILRDVTESKFYEDKLLKYQAQLKSLASQLSLTEEREKHRIATELHDKIGQSLVISKVKLQMLQGSMSDEKFSNNLNELCGLIDQVIRSTRSLTFDLSCPILHELGFEAAISEWLGEQVENVYGIATNFEDDGLPKPLDNDIKFLLFRCVRELLVNVVKHSCANKVSVVCKRIDSTIQVVVEDDGVGFNVSEISSVAAETRGFGLFSIRERLEQVGCDFELESEPGCGTRVLISAPLKEQKSDCEVHR